MRKEQQKWMMVKANICLRFGKICTAAAALDCTPEAMRMAVNSDRCPKVRKKMEQAGLLAAAA